MGYPHLAAFTSSETGFSIYRGFGYLHSRVLLQMQDELRCLEEGLAELDNRIDVSEDRRKLTCREFDSHQARRENKPSEHEQIMSNIKEKLVQYGTNNIDTYEDTADNQFIDKFLMKARKLNTFQRPSNRDYRNVRTWFWNAKPLIQKEEAYILRKEDLLTIRHGREWAGFDGFIEDMISKLPRWFSRVCPTH